MLYVHEAGGPGGRAIARQHIYDSCCQNMMYYTCVIVIVVNLCCMFLMQGAPGGRSAVTSSRAHRYCPYSNMCQSVVAAEVI
jgi:hypothetical protein